MAAVFVSVLRAPGASVAAGLDGSRAAVHHRRMTSFAVLQASTLVELLTARLPSMKRGTLKDRLRDGCVLVNGAVVRRATTPVAPGDTVELRREGQRAPQTGRVPILHVDRELVVVDKPSGLLSVGAGRGDDKTVLALVGAQLKGGERLFPCHRLDQGTSGVLLLPRTPEVQHFFFEHWGETQKTYVALVEGRMQDEAGTVRAALYEDPRSLAVSVRDGPDARDAVTHFRVLARRARCTLVEIDLETGRKHQIRVHLRHLGHPVLGDDRYGDGALAPRLCLHARELTFPHPRTGERLTFSAPVPSLFAELLSRG